MQLRQIGIFAFGGVAIAFGFGVVANICIDLVWPKAQASVAQPQMQLASASSTPVRLDPPPAPIMAATPTARAAAAATPVENVVGTREIRPVRVKTVPMVLANIEPAIPSSPSAMPYAEPTPPAPRTPTVTANPKPRSAPKAAKAAPAEDADNLVLSNGQIDRIKIALALTPDQEAYWPAIAEELRAIAKQQPKRSATKGHPPKLTVDDDSVQRLYSAATPLIMRLREDQKQTVRQLALMLGLQEVAQAL
jgi:hypothetical protein